MHQSASCLLNSVSVSYVSMKCFQSISATVEGLVMKAALMSVFWSLRWAKQALAMKALLPDKMLIHGLVSKTVKGFLPVIYNSTITSDGGYFSGAFCLGSVAFYVLYMFEVRKHRKFSSSDIPGGSFLILFRKQFISILSWLFTLFSLNSQKSCCFEKEKSNYYNTEPNICLKYVMGLHTGLTFSLILKFKGHNVHLYSTIIISHMIVSSLKV